MRYYFDACSKNSQNKSSSNTYMYFRVDHRGEASSELRHWKLPSKVPGHVRTIDEHRAHTGTDSLQQAVDRREGLAVQHSKGEKLPWRFFFFFWIGIGIGILCRGKHALVSQSCADNRWISYSNRLLTVVGDSLHMKKSEASFFEWPVQESFLFFLITCEYIGRTCCIETVLPCQFKNTFWRAGRAYYCAKLYCMYVCGEILEFLPAALRIRRWRGALD